MVFRRFALIAVILAAPAWADLGMNFKSITPPALAEAVIKGVLNRDYVMTSEVQSITTPLTMSIRNVPSDQVLSVLRSTLASVGIRIEDRGGILYVERGTPSPVAVDSVGHQETLTQSQPMLAGMFSKPDLAADGEVYSYFPRNRSPEFLAQVVRLFGGHVVSSSNAMAPGVTSPAPVQPNQAKADVLIYRISAERNAKLLKLLQDIDRPQASVNVRAAVLEYSLGSESSRSVSAVFDLLRGKLGLSYAAGKVAANTMTFSGASLSAVLSAVDGDSRFKYVAEPSLRVLDGEKARLTVGQEVPVRGQVTQDRNGNSLQAVEYKPSGVILSLEPRIYRDAITLKIGHEISSFSQTTTSQIDSPTLRKRGAETVVSAQPGELIVIGGMDSTEESSSTTGLAFLPSWLRGSSQSVSRSQVLLMLELSDASGIGPRGGAVADEGAPRAPPGGP
ncbi:bacteriophage-related lipoprotein [Azospira sp. I13]|uniref:type II secretion system protein GspD n=1 Tax=Azospira sp. I13 TaxID=1765050 RepID=UPI000D4C4F9D|nr:hypothetical protein [Azospira sp. I13]GBG01432.1 bacteriophage-related lipoprotein [Azospira sp. I13]